MMRGTPTVLLAIVVLVAGLCVCTPLAAEPVSPGSVAALQRWVDAVNRHVPGDPDGSVRVVVAMTYGARRALLPAHVLFMHGLSGHAGAGNAIEQAVLALSTAIRQNPGARTFLKRAVVLHADAVVFADRFPAPAYDGMPIVGSPSGPPAALLTNGRRTLIQDGQIIGETRADWNLPFGRSLLDELLNLRTDTDRVSHVDEAFVGDWYHATAAFLFARGMNSEAAGHLEHAARVLPDDPRLLFDRGTCAETYGLPLYQSVDDRRVPSEEKTNAEAERLYRRTLELDPRHVEARVRLARLLDHRGRHDEAAAEIAKALDARPSGTVGFYAHIIAGRIATARERYDEALREYRDALALSGRAQSALLGASHAALMLGNLPQALGPIGRLDDTARDADPWLDYRLGAGREVKTLLATLWARIAE